MSIYKIELDDNQCFYGSTTQGLTRKNWGHKSCLNNNFCNCSLYQYMRRNNIYNFKLELIKEGINLSVLDNKLKKIREEENSTLRECRARMIIDTKEPVKNCSVSCKCNEKSKEDFTDGELYILRFD
tara:strand:- start:441 stop:821 length:381 start_codon:yes stop_codon:yes gene_type:complete